MAVINELGGEKIDIIEYSDDSAKYITNSLNPAKVLEVKILPKNKALAIVPEDQLSLAIGKDGQNVRLAAKLTGWKIDVKASETGGEESEEKKEEEPEKEEKPKKKEEKPARNASPASNASRSDAGRHSDAGGRLRYLRTFKIL